MLNEEVTPDVTDDIVFNKMRYVLTRKLKEQRIGTQKDYDYLMGADCINLDYIIMYLDGALNVDFKQFSYILNYNYTN